MDNIHSRRLHGFVTGPWLYMKYRNSAIASSFKKTEMHYNEQFNIILPAFTFVADSSFYINMCWSDILC